MVDLGCPKIVQSLKAHAWSDEVRKKLLFFSQMNKISIKLIIYDYTIT